MRADETCGQTKERKRKMASISGSSINSRESSRPLGVVGHFGIQCMALRPRIACRLDWTCRTERLGVSTLGGVDVPHWDWAAQSVHTRGDWTCRTGRIKMSTPRGAEMPHRAASNVHTGWTGRAARGLNVPPRAAWSVHHRWTGRAALDTGWTG